MKVTAEEIQVLSRLVLDLCGVVLDASKGYLIENRLSRIAEETGCKSFTELYYKARYDTAKELRTQIVDAITTNETLFFRDTSPFEALQFKVLPELIDARSKAGIKRLRIWSAACSSGQEPYSIAMLLRELLGNAAGWDINVLGTDISNAVIAQASRGAYQQLELTRGMPPKLLEKYFAPVPAGGYKVRDELRAMIRFEKRNLLAPLTDLGAFDVIFCRNVAIYFAPEPRRDLFNRLAKQLKPDGYLFVGSSENLTDCGPNFLPQHHCRAVFYRPNQPAAPAKPAAPVGVAAK